MLIVGLVFCFVIATIPCWIQKGNMKVLLFWGINNVLLTAALKVLIGEAHFTLLESFDDVSVYTLAHYFIPFLLFDIVGYIAGKFLLKDKLVNFQSNYLSGLSVCLICCFVLFYRIENVMLVVSAVLSLLVALILHCMKYVSESAYKKKLKRIFPVFILYVVTVTIFIPTEFVVYNYKDLGITIEDLWISQFFTIISLTLLLVVLLYFINDISLNVLVAFFIAVGICGYIQGNFLNGKLNVLDGSRPQEWSIISCSINVLIWFLIVGVMYGLYMHRKKWLTYLCAYICAVQMLSMVYIMIAVERPDYTGNYELTSEGIMEVGSEDNIIVFVLDWFDEQIMEKIISDSPDFTEPLHDFCWYQNCTSKYAFTDMSLPYLLTGVEWQMGMDEVEYSKYSHENGKLIPKLYENGYDIGIYTDTYNAFNLPEKWITNASTNIDTSKNRLHVSELLHRSTMYKIVPFALKSIYRYDYNAFTTSISTSTHNNLYLADRDRQELVYELVSNEKLQIAETEKYFKLIHLNGAHPGFCYDENMNYVDNATDVSQGKATLNIVYKYINQLKECGLYDNATIIITADHGQNYLNTISGMKEYGYDATSNPIMFVKLANQQSDELEISMAPVSHEQIIPTILHSIGIENDGRCFDDISENEKIVREFIFVRHPDIPYTRYLIDGNVRDVDNWKIDKMEQ